MKTTKLFTILCFFTFFYPFTTKSQTENNNSKTQNNKTSPIKSDVYIYIGQVLNDKEGSVRADTISNFLKNNNIYCVWAGSLGLSMNLMKKDVSKALRLIIDKWGINYLDLNIAQIADSVAKAELKKYNDLHPKIISEGQLSLKYYDKTIESLQKKINAYQINYNFNQELGGKVLFQHFSIIIDIDTQETKFITVEQKK